MRVLSRADVERLVTMGETIDLMREVFTYLGRDSVQLPERVGLDLHKGRDSILFMPADVAETRGVGLKVVSVFPDNPRTHRLPTINGVVMLTDPATGLITTLMDATYLTALRTGAVSGLATDLLARRDARVLTVFGAGVQARTQIEAVPRRWPAKSVRAMDPAVPVRWRVPPTPRSPTPTSS
jgi:ornithine cyclodeaminase/alanine dehydrogenase-like protein (mu-crystallin family)